MLHNNILSFTHTLPRAGQESSKPTADPQKTALQDGEPWVKQLGNPPKSERGQRQWQRVARTVAAYRDRYQITSSHPLGAEARNIAQKVDHARSRSAATIARSLSWPSDQAPLKHTLDYVRRGPRPSGLEPL